MAYIGDGNNVAHSLMIGCAQLGCDIAVASPKGYEPLQEVTDTAREFAKQSGAEVTVTTDPVAAVKDADVIYSDVFTSMGGKQKQRNVLLNLKNIKSITN
ncbi:hypothetical protein BsIDN1_20810 [Bacillus safensis]|uniref:Aspartate/ornithine carbamoyltransferase Asp/Orn-binding domain-containing protein n=1 Tax=Bacillus safensis TaxID=561879 RepID=A0A5S9M5R3_BACIA|nr:hypothetical protein BsIDN1_20810 [Bacillus safensis]